MRCLALRLFTLCTAVSLLLCVAVCVLWIRSKWVTDRAWRGEPESDAVAVVTSEDGTLNVATVSPWASVGPWRLESVPRGVRRNVSMGWFPYAQSFSWPGVLAASGRGQLYVSGPRDTDARQKSGSGQATMVYVSMWFLAAVTAAPPVLVIAWRVRGRVRRRRRRSRGLCLTCGYDLRASTERCPECGKRVGDTHHW